MMSHPSYFQVVLLQKVGKFLGGEYLCKIGYRWRNETQYLLLVCSGTDEAAILNLLTARSNAQRQQIKAAFKTLHGKVKTYTF